MTFLEKTFHHISLSTELYNWIKVQRRKDGLNEIKSKMLLMIRNRSKGGAGSSVQLVD